MATMTTDERLDTMSKSLGDLAGVVRDLAVHVYSKEQDDMYDESDEFFDDEDIEMSSHVEVEEADTGTAEDLLDTVEMEDFDDEELDFNEDDFEEDIDIEMSRKNRVAKGEDFDEEVDIDVYDDDMELEDEFDDVVEDDFVEDDFEEDIDIEMSKKRSKALAIRKAKIKKARAKKAKMQKAALRKKSRMSKGYANRALRTADEEDAPFDEQQDDVVGNEPSPAGRMGGTREDETFNVNFSKLIGEVRGLRRDIRKGKLSKARGPVPAPGTIRKGRTVQTATDNGMRITRDMESQIKSRSFRELNQLREEMGLLNRNAFGASVN